MFSTIFLELFLPFRSFKETANIRWTTISAQEKKQARQLSTCFNKPLTTQRWSHRLIEPWTKNLKSLKNMVCCRLMLGSKKKKQTNKQNGKIRYSLYCRIKMRSKECARNIVSSNEITFLTLWIARL